MKTLITFLFIISLSWIGAQTEINHWIENHPEVTIMNRDKYNQLDGETQKLLTNVLLYTEKITVFDIENYSSQNSKNTTNANSTSYKLDEYAQFIKDWLALNQHVKLVKQSYYSELSVEEKQDYLEANALILAGESITYQDIINY